MPFDAYGVSWMLPGLGSITGFLKGILNIPKNALNIAKNSIKSIPSKMAKSAMQKSEEGLSGALDSTGHLSTLKGLVGNGAPAKAQAKALWRTINQTVVQPILKPLPKMKFVNTENLIKKPFKELTKQAAKDKLNEKKETRSIQTKPVDDRKHSELKDRWKTERKQRNSSFQFHDTNISANLADQQAEETRYLQDYYSTLFNQDASDREKLDAQYQFEKEKLNTKYEQLQILQNSLNTIQANFGKLASFNDNGFDVIQEQIAVSADLSDSKQSTLNENLASDIQYLQSVNDSNAEAIVEVLAEGQEQQAETLNQLAINEQGAQERASTLGTALESIEQQQHERHIQQMYVLDNMGAELMAASRQREEQQEAQSTEQEYLYNKFAKKQKKMELSLPGIITGAIFGLMSSFLNAVAHPDQMVETIASTVGNFAAEVLSLVQFIWGNGVYAVGHLWRKLGDALVGLLQIMKLDGLAAAVTDPTTFETAMTYANILPKMFGNLGLPDMILVPKPSPPVILPNTYIEEDVGLLKEGLLSPSAWGEMNKAESEAFKKSVKRDGWFKALLYAPATLLGADVDVMRERKEAETRAVRGKAEGIPQAPALPAPSAEPASSSAQRLKRAKDTEKVQETNEANSSAVYIDDSTHNYNIQYYNYDPRTDHAGS